MLQRVPKPVPILCAFAATVFLALVLLGKPMVAPLPPKASPALWVVRDGDTTIYLFGTMHLQSNRTPRYWLRSAVRQAFDTSSEVKTELIPPEVQIEQRDIRRAIGKNNPVPLAKRLPPALYRKLTATIAAQGSSARLCDICDTWLVATALSSGEAGKLYYDSQSGIDEQVISNARRQGKKLLGFETLSQQLELLAGMSQPGQAALLDHTIDVLPDTQRNLLATDAAWAQGDTDTLGRLLDAEMQATPELRETMLIRRNAKFADWVIDRMKRPGTVFLAVGVGHMIGSQSLIEMLSARGLKVMRIRYP